MSRGVEVWGSSHASSMFGSCDDRMPDVLNMVLTRSLPGPWPGLLWAHLEFLNQMVHSDCSPNMSGLGSRSLALNRGIAA